MRGDNERLKQENDSLRSALDVVSTREAELQRKLDLLLHQIVMDHWASLTPLLRCR